MPPERKRRQLQPVEQIDILDIREVQMVEKSTLSNMRGDLEYLPIRKDPGRVHMSKVQEEEEDYKELLEKAVTLLSLMFSLFIIFWR